MRLLLCLLLIAASVSGQDVTSYIISGYRGLDTRSSDFTIKPNWARVAHNVDLGTDMGSIDIRKGYDSVSTISGMDSILPNGLFAAYWEDGQQQALIAVDSAGVGYGGLYITAAGSVNISTATRIQDYWGVNSPVHWAQVNDQVYITNGDHGGVIYSHNTGRTHEFPVRASGEPRLIPLSTSGNLNGEYRYMIASDGGGWVGTAGESVWYGPISAPVRVDNGQVLVTGFVTPQNDSLDYPDRYANKITISSYVNAYTYKVVVGTDSGMYVADADDNVDSIAKWLTDSINTNLDTLTAAWYGAVISVHADSSLASMTATISGANMTQAPDTTWLLTLYRSKVNPGEFDGGDSMFAVTSITFYYNDTLMDTVTYTDNSTVGTMTIAPGGESWSGRDSTGVISYAYGAPRYVSRDTLSDGDTTATAGGVYVGRGASGATIAGYSYAVTFEDTLTGFESAMSEPLNIFRDSTTGTAENIYTIALPKVPDSTLDMVVNLYRASIERFVADSVWFTDSTWLEGYCEYNKIERKWTCRPDVRRTRHSTFLLDSLKRSYYRFRVALPITTTTFTDSLRYDYFQNDYLFPWYDQNTPPTLLTGLFSFQSRMWGFQGSRLYYSNLDFLIGGESSTDWGEFHYIPINEGDGDVITLAYPDGEVIKVFKNQRGYIVYEADLGIFAAEIDDQFVSVERSAYYGNLGPWSHLVGPAGHYFLSHSGVLLERASDYLARAFTIDTVSSMLRNFDLMTVSQKYDAFATPIPTEDKYCWTIGDTTFVWDNRARAWYTWDIRFEASMLYSAVSDTRLRRADTVYFSMPGDSTLYRYGADTDDGDNIDFEYETGPQLIGADYKSISSIGLWSTSTDSSSGVQIVIRLHTGVAGDTVTVDSLYKRFNLQATAGLARSLFYTLELKNDPDATDSSLANTVIDGIEIRYNPRDGEVAAE